MARKQIRSIAGWGGAQPRLQPEVWPVVTPSFTVPAGAEIFTIGSCFARNIERNLQTLGFNIPTADASMPDEEWGDDNNQFLNRFTPQSMWQEVHQAAEMYEKGGFDRNLVQKYAIAHEDKWIDIEFPNYVPVTPDRFFERREYLYAINKRIFEAGCVTITLGLIESWQDTETGLYLNSTPRGRPMLSLGERFKPIFTEFSEAYRLIDETVATIKRLNPDVKILMTTSPVPLTRTFTEQDVITANSHAKSVLRAVSGEICSKHDDVDYFPAYESVVLTKSWDVWEGDMLHPTKAFIAKIVERLAEHYFNEADAAWTLYHKSFVQALDGSFDDAFASINEALEQDPDNLEMLRHAAGVAKGVRNTEALLTYVERVVAIDPKPADLTMLAATKARVGDLEGAGNVYKRIVDMLPTNGAVRLQYARHLMRCGDNEMAERHIEYALEHNPNYYPLLLDYAKLALVRGANEAAIERSRRALIVTPPQRADVCHLMIGQAHLALGNLEEAKRVAFGDEISGENTSRILERLRRQLSALDETVEAQPEPETEPQSEPEPEPAPPA